MYEIFESIIQSIFSLYSVYIQCEVFAKLTLLGTRFFVFCVKRLADHLRPRKMVVVVRVSLDGLHGRIHDRVAMDRHFDDR